MSQVDRRAVRHTHDCLVIARRREDVAVARWLIGWLIGLPIGWLIGCLAGWLIGLLIGWLIGLLIGWLSGWLTGWLIDWLNGWLIGWPIGWLIGRGSCGKGQCLGNHGASRAACSSWVERGGTRIQVQSVCRRGIHRNLTYHIVTRRAAVGLLWLERASLNPQSRSAVGPRD